VPRDELGLGARIFVVVLMWVERAVFRIRVDGAEHLPAAGPAVVAANHVSALDGVILGAVIWWQRRRAPRFLIAAEFFRNPVFRMVLRALGQIPVHRGQGDAGAFERAVALASAGAVIGVFPEGRVNPEPEGPLQPARTGAARIALEARAPVVPMGIWGTQTRWPRSGLRRSRPLRSVVAFSFGPPVVVEGDAASSDSANAATETTMAAIARQVTAARSLAER
jgi:1-acyl-sn-glycerol-3-phosphate acyltransferase